MNSDGDRERAGGCRRKDFYRDDIDRQDFPKTLAEMCQKTGFQIHAYCLISNHGLTQLPIMHGLSPLRVLQLTAA